MIIMIMIMITIILITTIIMIIITIIMMMIIIIMIMMIPGGRSPWASPAAPGSPAEGTGPRRQTYISISVHMYVYIYIYIYIFRATLEGTKGVPRNAGSRVTIGLIACLLAILYMFKPSC